MSTLKRKQLNGDICLNGFLIADFLVEVVEMTKQGYVMKVETAVRSGSGYAVSFDASEVVEDEPEVTEVVDDTVEVVKIIGTLNMDVSDAISRQAETEPVGFDLAVIESFGDDKLKLDAYAETLGVKLNRSKTFKNMTKDLVAAFTGS